MKIENTNPLLRRRTVVTAALAAAAVSACGGGGSSTSTGSVRLLNATLDHASLDFLINNTVSQSDVAQDSLSAYASAAASGTVFQVNDHNASNGLASLSSAIVANAYHTILALESGTSISLALIDENFSTPSAGSVTLRIVDYAVQAGRLDVYITTTPVADVAALSSMTLSGTLALTNSTASGLSFTFGPNTYYITVTGAGNPADVRIFNESVTLPDQGVGSVLITPASGGLLVNGGFLVQQGGYTPFRTTTARVRLATSVTSNATVSATATYGGSSTVVDAGSVSPQLGSYVSIPASSKISILVNGTAVTSPADTLTAGGDYTILVTGSPSAAVATLITDDNRPSGDSTQAKLRLINAISGSASNLLTLTVNSQTIANSIAPGGASGYATITGSTTTANVVLYSSQHPGIYYSNTDLIFNAGGVFTVFATGDYAAPFLIVR